MVTPDKNNTEDILSSLDHISRAGAPAFFYTRLKARMEKGKETQTRPSWMLRPAYALAALVLILALNAMVIFGKNNNNDAATVSTTALETESMQSLASDFSLNDNASLVDLNQEVK